MGANAGSGIAAPSTMEVNMILVVIAIHVTRKSEPKDPKEDPKIG